MIPAETYSVGLLCAEIQEILSTAYDSVWVVGEVQRLRKSQRGHQYLELIEKGADDEIVGKLESVIWRTNARQIQRELAGSGQEIAEGQQIRLRGTGWVRHPDSGDGHDPERFASLLPYEGLNVTSAERIALDRTISNLSDGESETFESRGATVRR